MNDHDWKKGVDAAKQGKPMPDTRNMQDQQAKTIMAGYNAEQQRREQARREEASRRGR